MSLLILNELAVLEKNPVRRRNCPQPPRAPPRHAMDGQTVALPLAKSSNQFARIEPGSQKLQRSLDGDAAFDTVTVANKELRFVERLGAVEADSLCGRLAAADGPPTTSDSPFPRSRGGPTSPSYIRACAGISSFGR